jgi:hypothetical protein
MVSSGWVRKEAQEHPVRGCVPGRSPLGGCIHLSAVFRGARIAALTKQGEAGGNVSIVRSTSGAEEAVTPITRRPNVLSAGVSVTAKWLANGQAGSAKKGSDWYAGNVKEANADGTYNIVYDDGALELGVEAKHVRVKVNRTANHGRKSGEVSQQHVYVCLTPHPIHPISHLQATASATKCPLPRALAKETTTPLLFDPDRPERCQVVTAYGPDGKHLATVAYFKVSDCSSTSGCNFKGFKGGFFSELRIITSLCYLHYSVLWAQRCTGSGASGHALAGGERACVATAPVRRSHSCACRRVSGVYLYHRRTGLISARSTKPRCLSQ